MVAVLVGVKVDVSDGETGVSVGLRLVGVMLAVEVVVGSTPGVTEADGCTSVGVTGVESDCENSVLAG